MKLEGGSCYLDLLKPVDLQNRGAEYSVQSCTFWRPSVPMPYTQRCTLVAGDF